MRCKLTDPVKPDVYHSDSTFPCRALKTSILSSKKNDERFSAFEKLEVDILSTCRTELSTIGSLINGTNTAASLPPELLSAIFARIHLRQDDMLSASHVCHTWRTCALANSMSWSELSLRPGQSPEMLDCLGRRSEPRQLTLNLPSSDGRFIRILNAWSEEPNSPWARLRDLTITDHNQDHRDPTPVNLSAAANLRRIDLAQPIRIPPVTVLSSLRQAHFRQTGFDSPGQWPYPTLLELTWHPAAMTDIPDSLTLLFQHCQALTRLTIYGISPYEHLLQGQITSLPAAPPLVYASFMGVDMQVLGIFVYPAIRSTPYLTWYDDDPLRPVETLTMSTNAFDVIDKLHVKSSTLNRRYLHDITGRPLFDFCITGMIDGHPASREVLRLPLCDELFTAVLVQNLHELICPGDIWSDMGASQLRFPVLKTLVLRSPDYPSESEFQPSCPQLAHLVLDRVASGYDLLPQINTLVSSVVVDCCWPLGSLTCILVSDMISSEDVRKVLPTSQPSRDDLYQGSFSENLIWQDSIERQLDIVSD
ncbi:hypothetical protein AURDEDRAFT_131154 [Auricularia subglabra TFB-10046 SS5]|uniref:F-box domain-containing protein n=1 Tax=Auricularia subglabra (strain TFB-10046 / SS5) TaxID=717982 RepID=J0WPW0_AURST|nr:hypothetical protein AURDEDRAFT_131154 [Auricularia subglabra TFB-10046 SS5]